MEYRGFYNKTGYRILDENGDEIYSAGNSPYESQTIIDSRYALPLSTIKRYCNITGQDIADEKNGKWTGCKRYKD
jgi:hypothetical protein